MCGPLPVQTVQSQGDFPFPCLSPLLHGETEGERERWWGIGGNGKMSRGVNTETGVWQGTMIRFINQAMWFPLLGDSCKTLSANWSSQSPTAETLVPHSPSLEIQSSFLVFPHIPSCLSAQHLFFFFLFSPGRDYIFSLASDQDGSALKASFLLPSPSLRFLFLSQGCVIISPPPVSPDHWLAHNSLCNSLPAGVELSTLEMGLLRWSEMLVRCPGTIFLHLKASVLLSIL